ncbi:MAG TPA: helix-turn-helix transcriptional regulator [Thermoanaerobaculia bacterium]|jgi:transcriptional regulator with XRE-family HTH domain|nr:helix-turn-helix transcriptional regulator [Thermoanaerobaculia bacterium]
MQFTSGERPQSLRRRLGVRIAELRRQRGWSQEELADLLYVQRGRLSKWERGRIGIAAEDLLALSRVFDITADELLTGEPPVRKLLSPEEDAKLKDHLSAVLNLVK